MFILLMSWLVKNFEGFYWVISNIGYIFFNITGKNTTLSRKGGNSKRPEGGKILRSTISMGSMLKIVDLWIF